MSCASEKVIVVEVSRHTNKHVNVKNIFHDVNSYTRGHDQDFTKSYQCFSEGKLSLIHGSQHSQHPKRV